MMGNAGRSVPAASYAAGARGAREAARNGAAVVVVDTFRASTTISVLVEKGIRVVPVASIEEAASYPGADYRMGERGSEKIQGFDFGNSPTELKSVQFRLGDTVVLSTTNATRIIEAAGGATYILAGAFVNACAVADGLLSGAYGARVAVVGCGWRGHRSSEDEAAAGAILNHLGKRGVRLDGRAQRVAGRYLSRPKESLYRNSAAKRLGRLGYGGDIGFCLTEDIVPVVPRLQGGTFVGKW